MGKPSFAEGVSMPAAETGFERLAGVSVHYDRLPAPLGYGSDGQQREFRCRSKLKDTLGLCMEEMFSLWRRNRPTIILTAGTLGDGENAHGQGYAFDLDGFVWEGDRFMMNEYPRDRRFYLGINAHLFTHFSQVLGYHYPNHDDHFHVDFNFSFAYRTSSNAQTFFLQAALKYVFEKDLGNTGPEKDGVDGIYGPATRPALTSVLSDLDLSGQGGLTVPRVWREFLGRCRTQAWQ